MKLNDMTRALAPIAVLLVMAILVGCGSPTVATVNGETITAQEFKDRYQFEVLMVTGGKGLNNVAEVENAANITLATMISETIAQQKADELEIKVTNNEYQTMMAEFPNLDELIAVTVEHTDLSEERVRELWRSMIEGRILMQKLAAHYGRPEVELVKEWNSESDIEISEGWKAYIPAN